ncbi:MAG TPA: hypothetical protein VGV38_16590, partial [Pyrinomonadaceae bacterium]|nr:hypothetical protein [Pyrinomonadaceae bacterium]
MATRIFSQAREGFQLLLSDIWHRVTRRGAVADGRPLDLWKDDPGLQEALLAVRMAAAHVGESYEAAAARIEEEAARFREFIKSPTSIGKITLNVKLLEPDAGENEVYQVRKPAEGDATFFYTFERSDKIVLEFMAHDPCDNPLLPIVRTYSNWSGRRKFDLGLGRTFNLNMLVANCPDFIRVEAGFTTAHEDVVTSGRGVPIREFALAAGAGRGGGKGNVISWPYARLGMLSLAVGSLAFVLVTGRLVQWPDQPPRARAQRVITHPSPDALPFRAASAVEVRPPMHEYVDLFWSGNTAGPKRQAGSLKHARLVTASGKRAVARDDRGRVGDLFNDAVTRRVDVDEVLCRQDGSPCQRLLASIKNALTGALHFAMSHTLTAATNLGGQSPDALMVAAFGGAGDDGR